MLPLIKSEHLLSMDTSSVIDCCQLYFFIFFNLVTESDDVCVLPFTYKGKTYSTCISEDKLRPWCPTSSDFEKNGKWAYCLTGMPYINWDFFFLSLRFMGGQFDIIVKKFVVLTGAPYGGAGKPGQKCGMKTMLYKQLQPKKSKKWDFFFQAPQEETLIKQIWFNNP